MKDIFEKYALLDVFDVAVRDAVTKEVLLYSTNNTATSITGTSESLEIRNGAGNALWGKIYYNKSIQAEVTSNVTSLETIALLSGTTVSNNAEGVTVCKKQIIKCETDGEIVLADAPKDGAELKIFDKDGNALTITGVTDKTVAITGVVVGDVVTVYPYSIEFQAGEYDVININADDFTEACELVFYGALRNNKNKVVYEVTIVLPQATPSTDFSLSTSSEMSPSETTITFDALSENGSLAKIYTKKIV